MSKEAYYFSHDSNARNDPKILAMRSDYGIQGYGIYWVIIEMLREQENYKLPNKEYIFNAIAMQVQCKGYAKDDAKRFVESCINEYDLLQKNDEFIWSNSLLNRMEKRSDLSKKRSEAAKARWEKNNDGAVSDKSEKKDDAIAMQNNANAMQTDAIKGKEIKKKVNKKEIINKTQYAEFVFLTEEQYNKLISEHGENKVKKMIDVLDNYKGSSGKKYKDDYRAILNWVVERVNQNKSIPKKSLFEQGEESRKRQEEPFVSKYSEDELDDLPF